MKQNKKKGEGDLVCTYQWKELMTVSDRGQSCKSTKRRWCWRLLYRTLFAFFRLILFLIASSFGSRVPPRHHGWLGRAQPTAECALNTLGSITDDATYVCSHILNTQHDFYQDTKTFYIAYLFKEDLTKFRCTSLTRNSWWEYIVAMPTFPRSQST